ncbi:MAG TPA: hypothetical protein VJT85_00100 [Gemmatimonadaceae bacterium]|nr:hypothetical protein [Gemmatimonadaceae bacterium]
MIKITPARLECVCDWCGATASTDAAHGQPFAPLPEGWLELSALRLANGAPDLVCLDCRTGLETTVNMLRTTARDSGRSVSPERRRNIYLEPQCRHVARGQRVEERITFESVGPHEPCTYRYQKGPDVVEVCSICASFMAHLVRLRTAPANTLPPPAEQLGQLLDETGDE